MPAVDQQRRVSVLGIALYGLPLAVFALMFAAISAAQQRSLLEAVKAEWIELSAAAAAITAIWIPVAYFINRRRRSRAAPQEPPRPVERKAEPALAPKRAEPPVSAPPAVKPVRAAPAKPETYTPHIEENATRRMNVDYIPMLERALSQLKTNNVEARETVYDHAREVLVRNLRKMRPILSQSEVLQEKLALEEAIGRIEKFMEAKETGSESGKLSA